MSHDLIPRPTPGQSRAAWFASFDPAAAAFEGSEQPPEVVEVFNRGFRAGTLAALYNVWHLIDTYAEIEDAEHLALAHHAGQEALLSRRRHVILKRLAQGEHERSGTEMALEDLGIDPEVA